MMANAIQSRRRLSLIWASNAANLASRSVAEFRREAGN
jgi:hypothetical protein